jgi:hypothetical protein
MGMWWLSDTRFQRSNFGVDPGVPQSLRRGGKKHLCNVIKKSLENGLEMYIRLAFFSFFGDRRLMRVGSVPVLMDGLNSLSGQNTFSGPCLVWKMVRKCSYKFTSQNISFVAISSFTVVFQAFVLTISVKGSLRYILKNRFSFN